MKIRNIAAAVLLGFLGLGLTAGVSFPAAAAENVSPVVSEGKNSDEYRIEFPGIGAITSIVKPGGTAEAAVFEIPDDLEAFCGQNGEKKPCRSGDVFLEPGLYTLTVRKKDAAENADAVGVMTFSVNGELYRQMSEEDFRLMAEDPSIGSLFNTEDTELHNPELSVGRDPQSGYYQYRAGKNMTFSMSVPVGAVSTEEVSVIIGEKFLPYHVFHDGETYLMNSEGEVFREPGSYLIFLLGTEHDEDTGEGTVCYTQAAFTICGEQTAKLSAVPCPAGFRVVSAEREGNELTADGNTFFTDEEGSYSFAFAAKDDPTLTYSVAVRVDRTPPGVIIEEQPGKKLRVPLRFSVTEENCTYTLQNGIEEYVLTEPVINRSGTVILKVKDAAGNMRAVTLNLRREAGSFPVKLVILSAAAILGLLLLAAVRARTDTQVL